MKIALAFLTLALLGYSFLLSAQSTWPDELIITPEKTDFIKTSTYGEVMQFITAIGKKSSYAHVFSMGKSPEGKDIPVIVLANPAVKTSEQAKASGKVVVYVQGNI